MTSRQFSEAMAYFDSDPYGERRADMRMMRICQVIAASFSAKGTRPKMDDFDIMPDRPSQQTVEQQRDVVRNVAALFGNK